MIDFFARWECVHDASYRDLLADAAVSRQAAAFLPETVPLWKWINGRLDGELELRTGRMGGMVAEEDVGSSRIVLPAKSSLKQKLVRRFTELCVLDLQRDWHCYRACPQVDTEDMFEV